MVRLESVGENFGQNSSKQKSIRKLQESCIHWGTSGREICQKLPVLYEEQLYEVRHGMT
jgi:hypothetical protein